MNDKGIVNGVFPYKALGKLASGNKKNDPLRFAY